MSVVDGASPQPPAVVHDESPGSDNSRSQRLLPWRELVGAGIYVALLLVVARFAAAPLANSDTYFHLRFGEEFLDRWSLRDPGSVSSFATASWLPTQWLPEVVMAQTERWFGLAGVAWLYGLILVTLLATLYLSARRWAGPLATTGLMAAAMFVSAEQLSMRPQLLSFMMVAVTAAAWLRTREDQRVRWWLIPVTWLWAMVHGMWPIAIALGVVAVFGLALDRALPPRKLARAALVPLGSAAAAGLTPVGPALYGAVIGVGSRRQYFSEWGTPDFTNLSWLVLAFLLAVGAVLSIRRTERSYLHIGLLLTVVACAVWSWRTVPVAAMVLVPLIAAQTHSAGAPQTAPHRRERQLLFAVSVLAVAILAVLVPQTADEPPAQPSWVDPALSSLPAGTKVLDSWDYGGYLMWRYPQLDLLMHGYGDTFTLEELQRNTDILGVAPGWEGELRRTGCTVAVLRPSSALTRALISKNWTIVHSSNGVAELRAPDNWLKARENS
ncbi:MAG TPA: hypothetical protein VGK78_00630 [Nocardioides sp.]|uniref:hypothetical protein n=1 Tax=Nocardioides sp. TaxID=35761 RepID=UPI002F3E8EF7